MIIALRFSIFDSFFDNFKYLSSVLKTLCILVVILLFNYFLLKRQIKIQSLLLGSILSAFFIEIFSFILSIYLSNFQIKEQYYGLLTNIVALLIYLYFLSYSMMIGNQLNYMLFRNYLSENNI